jgi:acetyl esterase/lipase
MPPRPEPRRIAYADGDEQFGELWLPPRVTAAPPPVVAMYHGGFWKSPYTHELMDELANDLVARGIACWNVEYRRVGDGVGGGGWPRTYEDAVLALATLLKLPGVDSERVATCGHSAGGHMALWVAMDARRRATSGDSAVCVPLLAASLAGVLDVRRAAELGLGSNAVQGLMGGEEGALPGEYRAASLVDQLPLGLAQVIVHGAQDEVVPHHIAQSYVDRAVASGDDVGCFLVEGEDHMEVIDPSSEAWGIAAREIDRALSPSR